MVLVVHAHPYPDRSRANRAMLRAVTGLPGVEVRSLYDLYPDFHIDVRAEQEALVRAHTVVLQHPMYWYSTPALLSLWFEKVLMHGWAYGEEGRALRGKRCWWVVTTGSPAGDYHVDAQHGHPFEAFVPPMRQTMALCGFEWLPPLVVHGARVIPREALRAAAAEYRDRVLALAAEDAAAAPVAAAAEGDAPPGSVAGPDVTAGDRAAPPASSAAGAASTAPVTARAAAPAGPPSATEPRRANQEGDHG